MPSMRPILLTLVLTLPMPAFAQTFTVLKELTDPADGVQPIALNFIDGKIYGVAAEGGTYNGGVLFEMNPTTGVEKVIHNFGGANDGTTPYGVPAYGAGSFYGILAGGNEAIYAVEKATGNEKVLYNFLPSSSPSFDPIFYKGLIYGSAFYQPNAQHGLVYTVDPATGSLSIVYSFTGNKDGSYPHDPAINSGTLYVGAPNRLDSINLKTKLEKNLALAKGVDNLVIKGAIVYFLSAYSYNDHYKGTLYAYNRPLKKLTALHLFDAKTDGGYPVGLLASASGTTLYGTTLNGGIHSGGTLFAADPTTGALTVLVSFSCKVSCKPASGPVTDGTSFYGINTTGGNSGSPSVYKYTP